MKTNASFEDVLLAVDRVNKKYGYKLYFRDTAQQGKWLRFTITTKGGIPGARLSYSGRKIAAASWHAHGYLFEEIFKACPDCRIIARGKDIEPDDIWGEDPNVGSMINPMYMSQTSIL